VQTGDNSSAQTGDSSTIQAGGGGDKLAPAAPEPKAMKIVRIVAFCIGVVLVALAATGVIAQAPGFAGGLILMGGSAGAGAALKLLGVGG